jgi:hypothetical protein
MNSDLFCDDYYTAPTEKIVELIKNLSAWDRNHLTLYPKDVINMLIEADIITTYDAQKIVEENKEKTLDISLPTCYIR